MSAKENLKNELKNIGRDVGEDFAREAATGLAKRFALWFRDIWTKKGRKRIKARRASR